MKATDFKFQTQDSSTRTAATRQENTAAPRAGGVNTETMVGENISALLN